MFKSYRGFTLIEILLVIGLIAILAAIVIIAINPARQFAQARNTQRSSDVNAILNAIHQNVIDNRGVWDGSNCGDIPLPTTVATMSSSVASGDICDCLAPTFLPEMTIDPIIGSYTDCATYDSGYTVVQGTNGRVTIDAPGAELGVAISVTR